MRKRRRLKSRPPVFDPPAERWPAQGVYQLHVRVSAAVTVTVGRLGRFRFPAGHYVYTGRASRGLLARVRRHVTGGRRRHWHIDYLLATRGVTIERVALVSPDPEAECSCNLATGRSASVAAPGFGASDCRAGCGTHLWLVAASRERRMPERP